MRTRLILLISIMLTGIALAQPLNGSFTIGGATPDYQTIEAAAADLETNGIDGPVTFNIRPGIYESGGGAERVMHISQQISGAGGNNRITFRPDAAAGGNAENVVLRRRLGSPARGWLADIRTGHITLEQLTFSWAPEDTTLSGVQFGSSIMSFESTPSQPLDSINIRHCRFIDEGDGRAQFAFLFRAPGEEIRFENNLIDGAGNGIHFSKCFNCGTLRRVFINGNTLRRMDTWRDVAGDPGGTAIFLEEGVEAEIRDNDLDYQGSGRGLLGIDARGGDIWIDGNLIRHVQNQGFPFASFIGIRLNNTWQIESMISNNMISNLRKSAIGILAENANVKIYHNSVLLASTVFQVLNTALELQSASDMEIKNNLLLTRGGTNVFRNRALRTSGNANDISFENNIFYSEPFRIEFNGTVFDSLAGWHSAGFDSTSGSFHPEFNSDFPFSDLHLSACSIGDPALNGAPQTAITIDIDGDGRDPQAPTIGADEASSARPDLFTDTQVTGLAVPAIHVAAGDLDGDTDQDLAVVNQTINNGGSGDITIYWNDGSGGFQAGPSLQMGIDPTTIKAVDIDGDSNLDLVATTDNAPVIRWGEGNGNFSAQQTMPDPGGQGLTRVDDMAFVYTPGSNEVWYAAQTHTGIVGVDSGWVSLIFHDGNRQFSYGSDPHTLPIRAGMHPSELRSAELSGDGWMDLAINDFLTGKTTILINRGDSGGGWEGYRHEQEIPNTSGGSPLHPNLRIGDIDGDGDNDILLGQWLGSAGVDSLVLLRNNGEATFQAERLFLDGDRRSAVFDLFDYDGDGDPDIISATSERDLVLYLNNGIGQFEINRACQASEFTDAPLVLAAAPLDNDGSPDVLVLTQGEEIASWQNLQDMPAQTQFFWYNPNLNKQLVDFGSILDSINADLPGTRKSTSNVVLDVNVGIDSIYHTRDEDLELYLHHEGLTDTLVYHAGGSGQNFLGTILDDQASTPVSAGSAPFSGRFRPHSPLSVFTGANPEGDWILEVYDSQSGETGVLRGWSLTLTVGSLTGNGHRDRKEIAKSFELRQNYPNPFNPETTIEFAMPQAAEVRLTIFNVLGQQVRELARGRRDAGVHRLRWDGRDMSGRRVASGMYFYRLMIDRHFAQTHKMLLVR